MNKCILLLAFTIIIAKGFGQHKTLTLYYPDSTRVVNISGLDSMVIFICGSSKVSYGGKDYNTVLIGNQCWLKENLDIGTMVLGNSTQTNNGTIEKYCSGDNAANCVTHGGLYQWNEAMQYVTTEGTQGICPTGWHIPRYAEFQSLSAEVSGNGNALKAIGQGGGDGAGTNTSGFSALLAGLRNHIGTFSSFGYMACFWGSTRGSVVNSNSLYLYYDDSSIAQYNNVKEYGFSVRCLKD